MSSVLDFVCSRSWALERQTLDALTTIVKRHVEGTKLSEDQIDEIVAARKKRSADEDDMQAMTVEDGVATIPIHGVIAKFASQVNNVSAPRGTSVEEVRRNLTAALDDDSVRGILLDIDSPGGSVDGLAELADDIRVARDLKPVYAFADGMAASAAYWLGSQASEFYATKDARVGSIGVYSTVIDDHVQAHKAGIKVDVIKAGKFKGVGERGTAITPDQRDEIQREVNEYYDMFVADVASGRGITEDQARELGDGRVHIGAQAEAVGLIDGVVPAKAIKGTVRGFLPSGSPQATTTTSAAEGIADGGKEAAMPKETATTEAGTATSAAVAVDDNTAAAPVCYGTATTEYLAPASTEPTGANATKLLKAARPYQLDLVAKLIEDGHTTEDALVALALDAKEKDSEAQASAAEALEKARADAAQEERSKLMDQESNESLGAVIDASEENRPRTADEGWAAPGVQAAFFSEQAFRATWDDAVAQGLDPWAEIKKGL